jgi:sugar/nucleoside kinase (ribokinase family)
MVFLGNIDPELQLDVLEQVTTPALTCLDTMNFWIERKGDALDRVVRRVDAVLINEDEIRQYTGKYNVLEAARDLQERGPRFIIVKRGEYGAVLFGPDEVFIVPAFPTWEVRDTTGAGDSFAGGFVGYLDSVGTIDAASLRSAMVFGSVVASHTVEDFSINGLLRATGQSVADRYQRLAEITRIDASAHFNSRQPVAEGA